MKHGPYMKSGLTIDDQRASSERVTFGQLESGRFFYWANGPYELCRKVVILVHDGLLSRWEDCYVSFPEDTVCKGGPVQGEIVIPVEEIEIVVRK